MFFLLPFYKLMSIIKDPSTLHFALCLSVPIMVVKIIRKATLLIFPNKSTPSPVPPSPVQAQPTRQGIIPSEKKILAFRTITKLLSLIQQEQAFRALSTRPPLDAAEKKELSLCTAFATLAVINREVFAVVTQRSNTKLNILCTTSTPTASTPTTSTTTASTAPKVEGQTITGRIFKIPGFDLNDDETVNTCVNERW